MINNWDTKFEEYQEKVDELFLESYTKFCRKKIKNQKKKRQKQKEMMKKKKIILNNIIQIIIIF